MSEALWAERALPVGGDGWQTLLRATVTRTADLTRSRGRLAAALTSGPAALDPHDEDVEKLLLAFEELASNGLRHGGQPVEVTVTATGAGWLLVVSDASAERPPTPAVDRDPANGGLGLYLVARLATAHGWISAAGRKHVWACLRHAALA
jgi:two-component sensor histidine kinase